MGRHAQRRAANSANRRVGVNAAAWFAGQSFNGGTRGETAPLSWMVCSTCAANVTILVDGQCFRCHAPAEGKNFKDMTGYQREETHTCGVLNRQHTDGWDGSWLGCEEAKRRTGK